MSVLRELAAVLEAEGGLIAQAVRAPDPHAPDPARFGPLAAAGPRAEGHEADYAVLVEAIHEGSLLHYGAPRVVVGAEPDLALLAGDRLYALGLARLAALGDLEAVAELADVISLCAKAHAERDAGLAEAVWEAGAVAIGWGATPEHEAAKAAARAGEPDAADALRAAARAQSGNRAHRR